MKIIVISGSTRPDSQSRKVAEYLDKKLVELGAQTELVDLNESRLPIFDNSSSGPWEEVWNPIKAALESADGYVFVSPEWDGMFSVGLHNMFHYAGNALAHKPVTLASVSDGMGGIYPLAQLRATGPKNTHYVVTPENLRFSDVNNLLVNGEITQDGVRARADYALKILIAYAEALKQIRDSGIVDLEQFKFGV